MTKKMEALTGWISELCWPREPEKFVEVVEEGPSEDGSEHKFIFKIYTKEYYYYIVALDRKGKKGYLGCQSSRRAPLAGENWLRGNDLPDGSFTKKTWDEILQAIAHNEMVPISDYILSGRNKEFRIPAEAWVKEDCPLFDGNGIEEIPDEDDGLSEGSRYLGDMEGIDPE